MVRLLTPFDPIVWDRRRFELLWGWAYRFEAYTPVAKRKLGYYALPMLWREHVMDPAIALVAVGGYGRAEKQQVQKMVKAILSLQAPPTPSHASDALAVAICHALAPPLLRIAG